MQSLLFLGELAYVGAGALPANHTKLDTKLALFREYISRHGASSHPRTYFDTQHLFDCL